MENTIKQNYWMLGQEPGELNKNYKYIWGGTVYNTETKKIEKYFTNKNRTELVDVTYVENYACTYEGYTEGFDIYINNTLMGFISDDYKQTLSYAAGGDYWLNGLKVAYSIVKDREAKQQEKQKKQQDDDFFKCIQDWS